MSYLIRSNWTYFCRMDNKTCSARIQRQERINNLRRGTTSTATLSKWGYPALGSTTRGSALQRWLTRSTSPWLHTTLLAPRRALSRATPSRLRICHSSVQQQGWDYVLSSRLTFFRSQHNCGVGNMHLLPWLQYTSVFIKWDQTCVYVCVCWKGVCVCLCTCSAYTCASFVETLQISMHVSRFTSLGFKQQWIPHMFV